eukprot:NODE_6024_length_886_cov_143.647444_g5795_i0.p1 GENE.NODE_6024_length_886_cov_143.647444_g5795_i0~~NODE_6024_length_886_cov_143.647444_g5795_i0.p1  ORF type:complete len:216 (+),score=42.00 NODE_6024_length_886_cov_143.647444_g5795_i0:61-708(+)
MFCCSKPAKTQGKVIFLNDEKHIAEVKKATKSVVLSCNMTYLPGAKVPFHLDHPLESTRKSVILSKAAKLAQEGVNVIIHGQEAPVRRLARHQSKSMLAGSNMGSSKKVASSGLGELMAVSVNGRCGPSYGNTQCPSGECCSEYDWCGTETHCSIHNGYSHAFDGSALVSDGRCGPEYDHTVCPSGECCSIFDWCGTTAAHCGSQNGYYHQYDGQ